MQDILSTTLEDARLSRAERRALKAVLEERHPQKAELLVIRDQAFDLAREALAEHDARAVMEWLEKVVRTLERAEPQPVAATRRAEAAFSPGAACRERITALFSAACHSVDICVFTITDNRLAQAILGAKRRGVKIRVISDDEKAWDTGSDIQKLSELGIPVRTDSSPNHMHHKFAVFDRQTLLTGSYNWTRSASDYNHENVVILEDPALVASFSAQFERLWERFE